MIPNRLVLFFHCIASPLYLLDFEGTEGVVQVGESGHVFLMLDK
jgi:hypothetical protein